MFFFNSLLKIIFRFPCDDLLSSFSVLSLRPITFLKSDELEEYGQNEIRSLCDHYGAEKSFTWKENGLEKEKTTPPLVALDETLEEWQLLKKTVLAEQYPRDCMWQLWNLIVTYHAKDFPNLVTLAQLGLTLAVHTAGCERDFSVQNNILNPSRNRLTPVVQQKLIRVNCGPERASFK